jgi:excisionase family DNA binding protein
MFSVLFMFAVALLALPGQTFLDREETAKTLHLSVTTVDRLRKAGKLRGCRIGRRVVFSPESIEAFRRESEVAEWGEAS